ncbi:hypothetical protein HFP89_03385 [Wenzhouxiangella sp. XN79A]|uniref:peptidylprolyl isomerase n=1 Tax=Wenzhouxiangella sp. XN79A TaxID=2724193 RepID=UPI00144ACB8D|nr:peptidylprolyl isomerase [Wenzhouxiangella sp. XN79A]NKI34207.1 hypothetical protein [Wenzhouxiangella sp. XN79A]
MLQRLVLAALFVACLTPAHAQTRTVWMETTEGPMILELDEGAAPITVANFLAHVEQGFYDGIIFHRVIEDFVVQAGAFDDELAFRPPPFPAIQSEASNGRLNVPGTIAMALAGSDVDSGRAQFFINTAVNDVLDGDFTVFGEVVTGLNVLESIQSAPTTSIAAQALRDYPLRPVRIERVVETDGYPLMPLHTGSWFDPQNPGRGLNVEIANGGASGNDATLVIYLYDFIDGQQFWLAGSANFDFGPSAVTVPMVILDGPQFGDAFDPDDRNVEEWGTITFEVTGCGSAVMSYDSPEFGSGERPLARLTRPNDLDSCEGL